MSANDLIDLKAEARALLGRMGGRESGLEGGRVEARPVSTDGWSLTRLFPWLGAAAPSSPLSGLLFDTPVLTFDPAEAPFVLFAGQVTRQRLVDAAPDLMSLLPETQPVLAMRGYLLSDALPGAQIMLASCEPLDGKITLGKLEVRNLRLMLDLRRDPDSGEIEERLRLSGWMHAPDVGTSSLGLVSATLFAGEWIFELGEEDSHLPVLSLKQILALFSPTSVSNDAEVNKVLASLQQALATLSPTGDEPDGVIRLTRMVKEIFLSRLAVTVTRTRTEQGEFGWTLHAMEVTLCASPKVGVRLSAGEPALQVTAPWLSFGYRTLLGLNGLRVTIGGTLWVGPETGDASARMPGTFAVDLTAGLDLSARRLSLMAALDNRDPKRNTLANLLTACGANPTPALAKVTVSDLQFGAELVWGETGGLSLGLAVRAEVFGSIDLPLQDLTLTNGAAWLRRPAGGRLAAGLEIDLLWKKRLAFQVAASYNAEALTFQGALRPQPGGAPLTIGTLIELLEAKNVNLPLGLGNLEIRRLAAGFTVALAKSVNSGWEFGASVRWPLPVQAGGRAVVVTASVDLKKEGDKPLAGQVNGTLEFDQLGFSATLKLGSSTQNAPGSSTNKTFVLEFKPSPDDKNGPVFKGTWDISESRLTLKAETSFTLLDIIGRLLGCLGLANNVNLPEPWDVLGGITLSQPGLEVDFTRRSLSLSVKVNVPVSPTFAIGIKGFILTYGPQGGRNGLRLAVDAEVLGTTYSTANGNAISWDLTDPKPPLPPRSNALLDLRYLGIGQHVNVPELAGVSVAADIATLRDTLQPPPGKAVVPSGLRFDAATGLLLAADFTVKDTLTLAVLYRQPDLFGLAVTLHGKRAGILDGLGFELRHRRIGGVDMFAATFLVPQQFRHLGLGAVGLTLGTVAIEIHSNGGYHFDLGFPANGDFGRSFVLQTPTLIGKGGFYITKKAGAVAALDFPLSSETYSGRFTPVVAAGVGLLLGVQRKVAWGPAHGEVSLTLTTILEGLCAWWEDPSGRPTDEKYYKFVGMAQVSAHIDVKVDLSILVIAISAEATAKLVLTMEANAPTLVEASFHIAAAASVEVAFVRITKSFEMDARVDASFGSASIPIWTPGLADRVAGKGSGTPAADREPPLSPVVSDRPRRILALHARLVPSLVGYSAKIQTNNKRKQQPDGPLERKAAHALHPVLALPVAGEGGFPTLVEGLLELAIESFGLATDQGLRALVAALADKLAGPEAATRLSATELASAFTRNFRIRLQPLKSLPTAPWTNRDRTSRPPRREVPASEIDTWIRKIESDPGYREQMVMIPSPLLAIDWVNQSSPALYRNHLVVQIFHDYALLLLRSAVHSLQITPDALKPPTPPETTAATALRKALERRRKSDRPETHLDYLAGLGAAALLGGARHDLKGLAAVMGMQRWVYWEFNTASYASDVVELSSVETSRLTALEDFKVKFKILDHTAACFLETNAENSGIHEIQFNSLAHFIAHRLDPKVELPFTWTRLPGRRSQPQNWTLGARRVFEERTANAAPAVSERLGPMPEAGEQVFLRPLPSSLIDSLDALAGYPVDIQAGAGGTIADPRFATLVPLDVERTPSHDTLLLRGADGAERHRLLHLWQDLQDPYTLPLRLTLLYVEPGPMAKSGGKPGSATLVGLPLDRERTRVIQWSLSTLTVADSHPDERGIAAGGQMFDRAQSAGLVSASLDQAARFVRLIWEASVADGDCTLCWKQADGTGVPDPDGLFADGGAVASVWLLALPTVASDAAIPRRHTNAVCLRELSAADKPPILSSRAPGAPQISVAVLPPGAAGVVARTPRPLPRKDSKGTARLMITERTRALFNLLTLDVTVQGRTMTPVNLGPRSPGFEADKPDATRPEGAGTWTYPFQITPGQLWPDDATLPALDPRRSPYRGIQEGLSLTLASNARDGFGNIWPGMAIPQPLKDAPLRLTYADDVLSPAHWPGLRLQYRICPAAAEGSDAIVRLSFSLDLESCRIAAEAAKAAAQWRLVVFQLMDAHLSVSLRSSLDTDAEGNCRPHTLPRRQLADFAIAAHDFFHVRARVQPVPVPRTADTLGKLLRDVLQAPAERALPVARQLVTPWLHAPLSELFGTDTLRIPVCGPLRGADGLPRGTALPWQFDRAGTAPNDYARLAQFAGAALQPGVKVPRMSNPFDDLRRSFALGDLAQALGMSPTSMFQEIFGIRCFLNGDILKNQAGVDPELLSRTQTGLKSIWNDWHKKRFSPPLPDRAVYASPIQILACEKNKDKSRIQRLFETRNFIFAINPNFQRRPSIASRLYLPTATPGASLTSLLDPTDGKMRGETLANHLKLMTKVAGAPERWFDTTPLVTGYREAKATAGTLALLLAAHGVTLEDFLLVNLETPLKPGGFLAGAEALPDPAESAIAGLSNGVLTLVEGSGSLLDQVTVALKGDSARAAATLQASRRLVGVVSALVPPPDLMLPPTATLTHLDWLSAARSGREPGAPEGLPLRAGQVVRLIVPPTALTLDCALQVAPAAAIAPLTVDLSLIRRAADVDADHPEAAMTTAAVTPAILPDDPEHSLDRFASQTETALPNQVLAAGHGLDGRQRLFVVDRARAGLASLALQLPETGNAVLLPLRLPSAPPLLDVRVPDLERGLFGTVRRKVRPQAEPLNAALRHLFETLEKLIAPELSGAVHYRHARALEALILAKRDFARALANDLTVAGTAQAGMAETAGERLIQELYRDLTAALRLDSIQVLATRCASDFVPAVPSEALPRIPAVGVTMTLGVDGASVNLTTLAKDWGVGTTAVATALADVPALLKAGARVSYPPDGPNARHVVIAPGQTLRQLLAELGALPPEQIGRADLDADMPLFQPGAQVMLERKEVALEGNSLRILAGLTGLSLRAVGDHLREMPDLFGAGCYTLQTAARPGAPGGALPAFTLSLPPKVVTKPTLQSWFRAATTLDGRLNDFSLFLDAIGDVPVKSVKTVGFILPLRTSLKILCDQLQLAGSVVLDLLADVPGLFAPGIAVTRKPREEGEPKVYAAVVLSRTTTPRQLSAALGFGTPAELGEAWDTMLEDQRLLRAGACLPLRALVVNATDVADATAANGEEALLKLAGDLKVAAKLLRTQLQGAKGQRTVHAPAAIPPRAAGRLVALSDTGAETTLGPLKLSLAHGDGLTATPLRVPCPTEQRLAVRLEQIEYAIVDVEDTGGYQASEWLHLLRPLQVAVKATAMPVRRAPAAAPKLWPLTQNAVAAADPLHWTYEACFEAAPAAGDELDLAVLGGEALAPTLPAGPNSDALFALQEYDALRPAMEELVQTLRLPPVPGTRVTDLLETLSLLVRRVAGGWAGLRAPDAMGETSATLRFAAGAHGLTVTSTPLSPGIRLEVGSPPEPLTSGTPVEVTPDPDGRVVVRLTLADLHPATVPALGALLSGRRPGAGGRLADDADCSGPVGFAAEAAPALVVTAPDKPAEQAAGFDAWLLAQIERLWSKPAPDLTEDQIPVLALHADMLRPRPGDQVDLLRVELATLYLTAELLDDPAKRAEVPGRLRAELAMAGVPDPAHAPALRYSLALWSALSRAPDVPLAVVVELRFR